MTSAAPDWGQWLLLDMSIGPCLKVHRAWWHKSALPDLIKAFFLYLSWPSAWLCSKVFLESSSNPINSTSTLAAMKTTKLSKLQPHQDFPGGPGELCFHCRGRGFSPRSGTKILHAGQSEKQTNKTNAPIFKNQFNWRLRTLPYCGSFLPYIDMNQPWVYMCPPSWISLPPPSPPHPSGLSQSTSFGYPASWIKFALVVYFTHGNIHVSVLFSHIVSPSPSPNVPIFRKVLYIHYRV